MAKSKSSSVRKNGVFESLYIQTFLTFNRLLELDLQYCTVLNNLNTMHWAHFDVNGHITHSKNHLCSCVLWMYTNTSSTGIVGQSSTLPLPSRIHIEGLASSMGSWSKKLLRFHLPINPFELYCTFLNNLNAMQWAHFEINGHITDISKQSQHNAMA